MKDIEDVFEIRLMLETSIVKKLQSHPELVSREKIGQLDSLTTQMSDPALSDCEFMSLDQDFHSVIYAFTNNPRLVAIFEQSEYVIRRIGLRVLHVRSRRQEVVHEHRQIIQGLQNGTAVDAVTDH